MILRRIVFSGVVRNQASIVSFSGRGTSVALQTSHVYAQKDLHVLVPEGLESEFS